MKLQSFYYKVVSAYFLFNIYFWKCFGFVFVLETFYPWEAPVEVYFILISYKDEKPREDIFWKTDV